MGGPGGTREGPPGRDSDGVAGQGADVAGFHGRGGRDSTSWTWRPTTGSSGPGAPPLRTGATASRTRRRSSLSPRTGSGAGDGRAQRRWSRAVGTGGWERTSDAGDPPGRPGSPDPDRPPHPPAVSATEGRVPLPVGERAGAASARTRAARRPHCPADCQSLTADPDRHPQHPPALQPPPPKRYHAARRRRRGERGARGWRPARRPSARRVEGSTRGVRPPPVNGWPPGAGAPRPPARSHRGAAPGDQRGTARTPPPSPPPPLPPRPTDSRRPARGTAAPQPPRRARGENPPPREGRDTQGGAPLPRYALLYAACPQ